MILLLLPTCEQSAPISKHQIDTFTLHFTRFVVDSSNFLLLILFLVNARCRGIGVLQRSWPLALISKFQGNIKTSLSLLLGFKINYDVMLTNYKWEICRFSALEREATVSPPPRPAFPYSQVTSFLNLTQKFLLSVFRLRSNIHVNTLVCLFTGGAEYGHGNSCCVYLNTSHRFCDMLMEVNIFMC